MPSTPLNCIADHSKVQLTCANYRLIAQTVTLPKGWFCLHIRRCSGWVSVTMLPRKEAVSGLWLAVWPSGYLSVWLKTGMTKNYVFCRVLLFDLQSCVYVCVCVCVLGTSMPVCVCVCVCLCVCVCANVCAWDHVHVSIYVWEFVGKRLSVCQRVSESVCFVKSGSKR